MDYDDYDDGSIDLKKTLKETLAEIGKEMEQKQQAENARKIQADTEEVIRGFCDSAGLSREDFQRLVDADPQATRQAFLESVRDYATRVTRRARDPRTGRFVSGPQAQRRQPEPASEYRSDYDVAARKRPASDGRRGTTDEVIAHMDRLLG